MDIFVVLLVLLINLATSFGLIGLLYLLAIVPLREQIKHLEKPQLRLSKTPTYSQMFPPSNDLPDMDDIPDEAFWGDEPEDNKTTPEDVEDAISVSGLQGIAERTQNTYNAPRTTSSQQLGSLKM